MSNSPAVVEGCEKPLAQRIADSYQRIRAFFKGRVRLEVSESADDLTQGTILLALKNADKFDPAKAELATWLITIGINHLISERRRYKSRPIQFHNELEAVDHRDNHDELEVKELIDHLGEEGLTIIHPYYFGGCSEVDLAKEQGLPLSTLKSRRWKAILKLRDKLGLADVVRTHQSRKLRRKQSFYRPVAGFSRAA